MKNNNKYNGSNEYEKAIDFLEKSSRRFKKKNKYNKRTFYHWDHNTLLCQETYLNMLGIGRTYFENIRNHLINNGLLPRIHGNIKRMPQWKTKMVIDKNVAEVVKNFIENYESQD